MTFVFLALLSPSVWGLSPDSAEGDDTDTSTTSSEEPPAEPSGKDGRPEEVESLMKNGVFIGSEPDEKKEEAPASTKTESTEKPSGVEDTPPKKGPPNPVTGGELVIQFDNAENYAAEQDWLQENLERYLKASAYVIIAEITDQRPLQSNLGKDVAIDVKISEYLRGSGDMTRSFTVPFNAPYVPGKPETIPPVIVSSYVMLMFVDQYGMIIDGNAMFVVDGKFAWRNKRPNVFLNPRHDRNWDLSAPIEDYTMYDLNEVRKQITTHNNRPWYKRCLFK